MLVQPALRPSYLLGFRGEEQAEKAKKALKERLKKQGTVAQITVVPPKAVQEEREGWSKGARFKVSWSIFLEEEDAKTPEEAARLCREILLDPGNVASIFSVEEEGKAGRKIVDVLLLEEGENR